jgi:hypothetical protein
MQLLTGQYPWSLPGLTLFRSRHSSQSYKLVAIYPGMVNWYLPIVPRLPTIVVADLRFLRPGDLLTDTHGEVPLDQPQMVAVQRLAGERALSQNRLLVELEVLARAFPVTVELHHVHRVQPALLPTRDSEPQHFAHDRHPMEEEGRNPLPPVRSVWRSLRVPCWSVPDAVRCCSRRSGRRSGNRTP